MHELDQDALVRILQEPKNALVNQYKHLFEIDNVDLSFRNEALLEIAKQAIKRKTGALMLNPELLMRGDDQKQKYLLLEFGNFEQEASEKQNNSLSSLIS